MTKTRSALHFGLVYAVCALTESTSFSLSYELYAKLSFLDNHKNSSWSSIFVWILLVPYITDIWCCGYFTALQEKPSQ